MDGYDQFAVGGYVAYLLFGVALTAWVGRTLYRNGRVFLVDAFAGNNALADSVNHLLIVGFYLINVGFITIALKDNDKPHALVNAIEFVSTKVGYVLVVLGVMHFFNMYGVAQIRKHGWFGVGSKPQLHTIPVHSETPKIREKV